MQRIAFCNALGHDERAEPSSIQMAGHPGHANVVFARGIHRMLRFGE
jgi:hypothetical protein